MRNECSRLAQVFFQDLHDYISLLEKYQSEVADEVVDKNSTFLALLSE